MKKYRVTEKHPYLKEGLIIAYVASSCNEGYDVYKDLNLYQLANNYIEEIQEPEFTIEDMEKAFTDGVQDQSGAGFNINNYLKLNK